MLSGTVGTCQELITLVLRSYMPVCTAGFGALDILNQLRWVFFFQVNNKKEVPFANYPYETRTVLLQLPFFHVQQEVHKLDAVIT